jgi:NAD(P)H-flavin reductase
LPEPSLLRRGPSRYLKNDPATGKLRWLGKLVLAEKEDVTHNVKTFRFRPANGAGIPFDYLPGQFLTLHIAPEASPPSALTPLPPRRRGAIASKSP